MIKITLYCLIGFAFFLQSISAQCLQCDSNNTGLCNNPNGNGFSRACSSGRAECYVRTVEGRVIRGCQNDLPQAVLQACTENEEDVSCRKCNFPNCNSGLFPHHRIFCHHCDERQNEGNCTEALVGSPSPCRTYQVNDKCIVRKHGDHVIRECLSDYEDCNKEKSCKKCDSHGCNNEKYNSGVTIKQSFIVIGLAVLMTKLFQ